MEKETAMWIAQARRELSHQNTRELGKVRMALIEECRKVLKLMKQQTD